HHRLVLIGMVTCALMTMVAQWVLLYFGACARPSDPHSFPTRRSSDLATAASPARALAAVTGARSRTTGTGPTTAASTGALAATTDRKSTRLNSSHVSISYADFCLKKKRNKDDTRDKAKVALRQRNIAG